MENAQIAKYASMVDQMGVTAGDHVLEIGCGWGGLLEHLAQMNVNATGVSISAEQVAYARDRLANREGVEAVFQDYRDVSGSYDRILSVEMFEAVGVQYWDTFAGCVARSLKRDGVAAMQIITIDEDAFEAYQARPDFVQKHVFPGGMLPTITHLYELFARHGLTITDLHRFGQDYATTLGIWRRRFISNWLAIREQGFDERFFRLWDYYLTYCEAGFRLGRTDVVQIRLEHS